MAPRSTRFGGPILLPAGDQLIYTVPVGKVAFVRSLTCVNVNALARTVDVGINGIASANLVLTASIARAPSLNADVRLVLAAGETLHAQASAVNSLYLAAFGFLFDA